jgi:OOP family OmpA-OmpF porin
VILRAAALILAAAPAPALDMPLPASVTLSETEPLATHRIATGPFADGGLPVETVEGTLTRTAHRMAAPGATPTSLMAPLRDQLDAQGWETVFACADRACGGFEFRFEIDVAPAPAMFVDLGAFRYLAARRGAAWTTLIASVSAGEGYVEQVTVTPTGEDAPVLPEASSVPAASSDLATALSSLGRAVLDDLAFPSGATELPEADYPSLAALAEYLRAEPSVTIALVGHTDAEGGAEGNMAISRRRAESARALLTGPYGIEPGRVAAFGVGFFSPLAPNTSDAGRERNRRVEVVVTSTE